MIVTMYLYSSLLPEDELTLLRCLKCSRTLFKTTRKMIVVSNANAPSFRSMPSSEIYIETQCHSCKTIYKVLFQ